MVEFSNSDFSILVNEMIYKYIVLIIITMLICWLICQLKHLSDKIHTIDKLLDFFTQHKLIIRQEFENLCECLSHNKAKDNKNEKLQVLLSSTVNLVQRVYISLRRWVHWSLFKGQGTQTEINCAWDANNAKHSYQHWG